MGNFILYLSTQINVHLANRDRLLEENRSILIHNGVSSLNHGYENIPVEGASQQNVVTIFGCTVPLQMVNYAGHD